MSHFTIWKYLNLLAKKGKNSNTWKITKFLQKKIWILAPKSGTILVFNFWRENFPKLLRSPFAIL